MKKKKQKNLVSLFLLFAASAAVLTIIQVPFKFSALAWIAYVPFIFACKPNIKIKKLFAISYLVSAVYWLGNLYWMGPVTWQGWVTFCLYIALLWPILAICFQFARGKGLPLFIAAPVFIVGAERLQGLFLGGFFWRFLAHSQFENTALIQIADIFGAAGISFLVATVNGLIAEFVLSIEKEKKFVKSSLVLKSVITTALLAGALIYGQFRISQTKEAVKQGPLIASVQSNVPQSIKGLVESEEVTFKNLVKDSNECLKAGAELVAWPETMIQSTIDPRVLRLLSDSHSYKIVDKKIKNHAKNNAYILVGAYGANPQIQDDFSIKLVEKYNSVFLYRPDGNTADKQYNKIHLVPFGEVVPFKNKAKWVHKVLMKFTPYDYDYSLDAGNEYTVFEMAGKNGEKYKFGTMICYEDAIAKIARKFATKNGEKQLDWLVNISNDGWFVRLKNGKISASTELSQHMISCVFRAVENRLAILRSVNTGISCLVDTTGRIKNGFTAGTLPIKTMKRQAVAGWFVDNVPIDERITFFSKYGQWLDLGCAMCLCILAVVAIIKTNKKTAGVENDEQKIGDS